MLDHLGQFNLKKIYVYDILLDPRSSQKIGSVRPSVLPSVLLSRHFFGIVSLFFSEIWHGDRILCEVVRDRAGFSGNIFLLPKLGKFAQNGPKTGFFNLLENLVINVYWIWSIMKIYIIYWVPAEIPYLGKFLFLRYGPKYSQPIR